MPTAASKLTLTHAPHAYKYYRVTQTVNMAGLMNAEQALNLLSEIDTDLESGSECSEQESSYSESESENSSSEEDGKSSTSTSSSSESEPSTQPKRGGASLRGRGRAQGRGAPTGTGRQRKEPLTTVITGRKLSQVNKCIMLARTH